MGAYSITDLLNDVDHQSLVVGPDADLYLLTIWHPVAEIAVGFGVCDMGEATVAGLRDGSAVVHTLVSGDQVPDRFEPASEYRGADGHVTGVLVTVNAEPPVFVEQPDGTDFLAWFGQWWSDRLADGFADFRPVV